MIMSWTTFSRICDILGFISFFLSIGILKKFTQKPKVRKKLTKMNEKSCSVPSLRCGKIFGMTDCLHQASKIIYRAKYTNFK